MAMKHFKKPHLHQATRVLFWFSLGAILGLFFFASFLFILYKNTYAETVYPGIFIGGVDFSGKSKEEVKNHFIQKNDIFAKTTFTLKNSSDIATTSAQDLKIGYDAELLADQAYSLGRTENLLSNISLLLQAYTNGIYLPASYRYDEKKIDTMLQPFSQKINVKPVDAVFTLENNKVREFRSHQDGKQVDVQKLKKDLNNKIPLLVSSTPPDNITLQIPVRTVKPKLTIDKANNMGIKELVGEGTSHYAGSIPNRIFNISLAASRVNGTIIPPGTEFSFNKTIGDVSSLTGYKQAYIISGGRTQLGDGGGVCQVSTTLFRAALNAGMPITERNQHAYRVSYYEQDMGPGIDAAIYTPNIDFKFKNDTKHHLLIQTLVDETNQALTFRLYGTKDGREVTIKKPVILSTSAAPEPLYQDDPNLPKDQLKQIDFAAAGANVFFEREVKKDGKVLIADKFTSRYRPWQAVFLRGTKQ
jgi:vancomycin resistance protein YoaR